MKFDYNFKNYDFRLVFYMVILNILGVLIMASAINASDIKDPQVVSKSYPHYWEDLQTIGFEIE